MQAWMRLQFIILVSPFVVWRRAKYYNIQNSAFVYMEESKIQDIAKSIGSPPSNERFDNFSDFHEYKS